MAKWFEAETSRCASQEPGVFPTRYTQTQALTTATDSATNRNFVLRFSLTIMGDHDGGGFYLSTEKARSLMKVGRTHGVRPSRSLCDTLKKKECWGEDSSSPHPLPNFMRGGSESRQRLRERTLEGTKDQERNGLWVEVTLA